MSDQNRSLSAAIGILVVLIALGAIAAAVAP